LLFCITHLFKDDPFLLQQWDLLEIFCLIMETINTNVFFEQILDNVVYIKPSFVTPIGSNAKQLKVRHYAQYIVHVIASCTRNCLLWSFVMDYHLFVFQFFLKLVSNFCDRKHFIYMCIFSILVLYPTHKSKHVSILMILIIF
jgi:hypothetical protein